MFLYILVEKFGKKMPKFQYIKTSIVPGMISNIFENNFFREIEFVYKKISIYMITIENKAY